MSREWGIRKPGQQPTRSARERKWGARKPGEWEKTCEWCGEKFFTNKSHKRFCRHAHQEFHEKSKEVWTKYKLDRQELLANQFNPYYDTFEQKDLDLSRPDDPYERLWVHGITDETEWIVQDLRRGVVWAKFAELAPRRIPFQAALARLDKAIDGTRGKKSRERAEDWAKWQARKMNLCVTSHATRGEKDEEHQKRGDRVREDSDSSGDRIHGHNDQRADVPEPARGVRTASEHQEHGRRVVTDLVRSLWR